MPRQGEPGNSGAETAPSESVETSPGMPINSFFHFTVRPPGLRRGREFALKPANGSACVGNADGCLSTGFGGSGGGGPRDP